MRIFTPEVITKDGEVRLQAYIEYSQGSEYLWYSVGEEFGDFFTQFSDGFLVGLFMPAMFLGEDIDIEGVVSERLIYNLQSPLQTLLKHVFPLLNQIEIFPKNTDINHNHASGVALGFSCGIDSFSALVDNYNEQIPNSFKITHLLFDNIGSHHSGRERLFKERAVGVNHIAESFQLPLIKVNSNLHNFYSAMYGKFTFAQSSTLRHASVPLILQEGINRFLYAATFDYKIVSVSPHQHINFIEPLVLPSLTTEVVDMVSVGNEYTRVEKTLQVADTPETYSNLDVCASGTKVGNCSSCFKCMETMMTFEIAGVLEKYSLVFDIELYKKNLVSFIGGLLVSSYPIDIELRNYAKECHYPFPIKSYIISYIYKLKILIKKFLGIDR